MENELTKPDAHTLKLLTPRGFVERYYELLPGNTQEEAYEMVENIYNAAFEKRRYANFDSFRKVRDRMHNSK